MDHVLEAFVGRLRQVYGSNLERVVLFGSRARGDAREASDYDVAVFLRRLDDRWREMDRLAELELAMLDTGGAVIHALPFEAAAYEQRTPLMHEIRREGVPL